MFPNTTRLHSMVTRCLAVLVLGVPNAKADVKSLAQLIAQATATHPAIQAQQALTGATQEGVRSARWQYYPTPSITVQGTKASATDMAYAGDTQVTVLALSQPVWTGGRIESGVSKALAYAQSANASLADTRQQLAIRVVQSYGDWLAANRKKTAYELGQRQHQRLKEQVERRIQEGQAAASDMALAQGRLASLQADLSLAATQEQVSLTRLSQLLGQTITAESLTPNVAQALQLDTGLSELLAMAQAHAPSLSRSRSRR